jgi:hypothetical protein
MSAEVADPRDFVETRSLASVIKEEMGDFSQMAKDMFRDECARLILSKILPHMFDLTGSTEEMNDKIKEIRRLVPDISYAMADRMTRLRDMYRKRDEKPKCGGGCVCPS